jgi:type IV pilus assembly protein PilW
MKTTMRINSSGFTLIEMTIAMALAAILITGIYQINEARQKAHTRQKQAVEMQQNIRAAISLMKREIRMAGYDPAANDGLDNDGTAGIDDAGESALSGIHIAGQNMVQFSYDNDASMSIDSDELVTYRFSSANDNNNDGNADAGAAPFGRATGNGTPIPVAESIHAVGFSYAFDNNDDGNLDTVDGTINGDIIWAFDADPTDGNDQLTTDLDTGSPLTPPVPLAAIRAVRIWILARTEDPVRGHNDNQTYTVGDRPILSADGYPRRLTRTTVYCRNMQL